MCHGVPKYEEIVFKNGNMVKGKGLLVLQEREWDLQTRKKNEIYKFLEVEQADRIKTKDVVGIYKSLGVEQADGIKTKNIFKRVKDELV